MSLKDKIQRIERKLLTDDRGWFLKVMNGTIIQTQTIELKKRLDESDEELRRTEP